jgi:serine/threonine protein kinase
MGEVRAAWDHRLDRPVAVKLLRTDVARQPGVRTRFEHEARTAARLIHPNVVTVFDTGEEGATAFLVMEQLSGRTLADDLAAGPLPADTVRSLGLQVLDALAAAHHMGLVHRDIKPSNLLVSGPTTWKVGDFGIAKSVEGTDPGLTSTGLVIGTPAYLSPERIAGAPASASSDLYALGLVLHEAATGDRVWRPHPMAPPSVPPLEDVGVTWAPSLSAAIQRAVDPEPARRFATAADMAAHLRADEPVPVPATAVLDRTTVDPLAPAPPGTPPSRRRRRLGGVAATGAALVILAGVLVALALSSGGSPTPPMTTSVVPTTVPATTATTSLPSTTVATTPTTRPGVTVPTTKPGHGQGDGGHGGQGGKGG